MTETTEAAPIKQVLFSPLKRFQRQHCQRCGDNCNPSEQRFLICVLAALLDTTQRINNLTQYRGAHL